jgi:predicted transcriptional regulator YdeE
LAKKEKSMRIIRNLIVAIIVTISILTQGCGESPKTSSTQKAFAIAEKPAALSFKFEDKDAFTVMGIQTRLTSNNLKDPETYTKIWENFEQYRTKLRPLSIGQQFYGVTFATNKKDAFDYLAGVSAQSNAMAPDINIVSRIVPAATYVAFKCTSQDMGKTQQYIYSEWLPKSHYNLDTKACCFEQYAPKEWMNRPVFIFIPIVPK